MSIYYDKINMYFRLKQQRSHYKRIMEAKKNIDFQKIQHEVPKGPKPYRKYQSIKQKQIKEDNKKLHERLQQIRNNEGLLQQIQKQSNRRVKKNDGKFVYETNILEQKINQENIRFISRLSEVKPQVGCRLNWEKQFKKTRSIEKSLHKFVKNQSIDPEEFIRETLTSLARRKTKSRKIHTSLTHNNPTQTQISSRINIDKKENEIENEIERENSQHALDEKPRQKQKRKYRKSLKKTSHHKSNSTKFTINEIILGMGPSLGSTQEMISN